ncbi:MAG: S-layer homology domain-containing protein [Clostridia bacterium]|nr:S-layer homology domain-containing protein [Clostridia bacterium]
MKLFRVILALVLALSMTMSFVAFAAEDEAEVTVDTVLDDVVYEEGALTDVDTSTVLGKAIQTLVDRGIVSGYPDGTFKAENNITRAEVSVIMVNFLNAQAGLVSGMLTGFADIDNDPNYEWARPYVSLAKNLGVINGFEDNTFRAAENVTYEQAVKMLVSSLGYTPLANSLTVSGGSWSSGYITVAHQIGLTANTNAAVPSAVATRGTVAMLTYNALSAPMYVYNTTTGTYEQGGNISEETTNEERVTGIVNGIYETGIEEENPGVPENHIMIDDEIYAVGFSADPERYLGCKVTAYIGDVQVGSNYREVTRMEVLSSTKSITVDYDLIDSATATSLSYFATQDSTRALTARLDDASIIYNGKYYSGYDFSQVKDDLQSGYIELICNDGDGRYEVVKIVSYEIFVVDRINTSTNKIYAKYEANDGLAYEIPEEGDSGLVFSMTRAGREITISDLRAWDVLNIMQSPEDVGGREVLKILVTRNTVQGEVTEKSDNAAFCQIANKDYYIAYNYLNYAEREEFNVGDTAQVYLDCMDRIAAAAENVSTSGTLQYGYLIAARQDEENEDSPLDLRILTTSGSDNIYTAADRIKLNGTRIAADKESVLESLEESAEKANESYPDAENVRYHQLIMFAVNTSGLVTDIDTVLSENEDLEKDVPYSGELTYSSSSRSFGDFKVTTTTKIFFIPDDRTETDDYKYFSSYSSAFTNGSAYHVEAYNLSSGNNAGVVLLYKENDSMLFKSSSPMMIVNSVSSTADGDKVEGYVNGSTSTRELIISEDCDIVDIAKGDVIRYLTDTSGQISKIEIWYDVSDPEMAEPVDSQSDAIDARILEIRSTSVVPVKNYPTATFRLAYGTVIGLDTDEDNTITVSPTITDDNCDMALDGNGVVAHDIRSSLKVFKYTASAAAARRLEADVDIQEAMPYDDYPDNASRVITYSTSGTLRMVYIITE